MNTSCVILTVEDDSALRKALRDKFLEEGFEVLEAENGVKGLKAALTRHPALILADIIMPFMDGIEMLRELRKDEWGKHVPVIMLTNLSDQEKIAEAVVLGSHEYIVKSDWRLEDIVALVKKHVR
jgi:DNA-binding response OmpR family regulator